ncbi:MAG: DUF484 family protein [Thiothrix sp.]|nr:DUF484 family protein [Thiothrix sp.]HPE61571.1 DUF484 family protein [Thiolinea sp.]
MSTTRETDDMDAEGQVVSWLQQHPDFFQQHEYLLDDLLLPHPETGAAVSLLERLVERQRKRLARQDHQLDNLLKAARENERVVLSMHHLALELLGCRDLDDVVATCRDLMCSEFDADNVVVRLIGRGNSHDSSLHFIDPDDNALKMMSGLLQKRQPVCGRLRPKQQVFLFGENSAEVRSAVLIPLFEARTMGMMALGSKREGRFQPGMGTLFISQIGHLVSRALSLHLETVLQPAKSSGT